jgi:transcriptional regulator with XRE-family HTH domain
MLAIMNTDKDQFAWVEWLIKEREEQGLSQADLARKTGLTRTTISDYERRQRANPDIEALWKISTALGYPDDFLPRLAGLLPQLKVWIKARCALLTKVAICLSKIKKSFWPLST